ncbi:hypothetical protein B0H17DRAFT_1204588 [Mycena rosella]|uniref:Uncharacterized protein n=1 Tax=Mycena rosella TaxID=1033263 RepID=A0AAD7GAW9_MYCRO|nr:hypothetical protein B0H17DRAFT_1204588 [Mycena rosella]
MYTFGLSSASLALALLGMVHAASCEPSALYAMLETGEQGCKYVPEVCRGLPEQLFVGSASSPRAEPSPTQGLSGPRARASESQAQAGS